MITKDQKNTKGTNQRNGPENSSIDFSDDQRNEKSSNDSEDPDDRDNKHIWGEIDGNQAEDATTPTKIKKDKKAGNQNLEKELDFNHMI